VRRKYASIGANRAFAIFARRLLGFDVHRQEVSGPNDSSGFVGEFRTKDRIEIRCRIGTDEENALAALSEVHRARTRERCLADTTLAGEEQVSWRCC
jgi:hypothetical protein